MLDIVIAMKLSNRLQFIYDKLLPQMPVWDFCCDHGYLGVEALKSRKFPKVSFVDQVPHIVENIDSVVQKKFAELYPSAEFITANAEDLRSDVTGNVVIAGVGAHTIFKILRALWEQEHLQATRLLLCPQRDEDKFLQLLAGLGPDFAAHFLLSEQTCVTEGARRKTIFIFDHSGVRTKLWTQAPVQ